MISSTPHRYHALTSDYSTLFLTIIFIIYCHFIPIYILISILPTEDYYTIQKLYRKTILNRTPQPFLKYYTTLYNDPQLHMFSTTFSILLLIILAPYHNTPLRPSFRTSLGIYTRFIIIVHIIQSILIAFDNIIAPLFPIILFIALKIFNEPTYTYNTQFTMIRNEVYWVPDQLIPPPPLRRLQDPYYYTSQPYHSYTLAPPVRPKSILLEQNLHT